MSAPAVLWGQGWVDADDSTLLALVRDGDAEAYAELWRRHLPAAYGVAHRYRGRTSAEDVVAEASLRVYDLIRAGKGPLTNFRSYFLSAVRTIAVDHARGELRAVPTEDATLEAAAPASAAYDPTPSVDHALVRTAFARLAERDQQVLWQTAVEGTTPAAVADAMGLSANGVSVIALRARDSLRAKYLDAHADRAISRAQDPECAWVLGQMGRFVRGKLPVRQRARVEEHLRSCRHAQGLAYEMAEVNRALPAVMVPLIFLAGSSVVGVWAGAAGAAGASAAGASGASGGGPREEGKAAVAAALVANVGTKLAALSVAAVLASGYAAAVGLGGGGGGAGGGAGGAGGAGAGSGAGGAPPAAAAPVAPGAPATPPPVAAPSQTSVPSPTSAPSQTAVPTTSTSTSTRPPSSTTTRSSSRTTSASSTSSSSTSPSTSPSSSSSSSSNSSSPATGPATPLLAPLVAVYGQPFIADIVVPLDGSSSVVIKSVPAGRMDLTAEPVPPLDGAGWSCEGSGPQVICTGSGPTGLSILAVAASHGSSSARMANQGPSQPAVVSLVLTDPAGTVTAAEVTVGEAPDPTPTDTGTPTSTETGTPTDTGTPTVTETATSTETGTPTVTETATSTETVTVTPTETWTWTWTWTRRDPSTWMPSSSPIVTVLSTATETMTAPETVQPTDTVTTSDTVTISPSGVIIITSPGKAIG